MHQTNHFFNIGYGWLCKHCSAEEAERKESDRAHHVQHKAAQLALAKWIDQEQHALECPRCGIVEQLTRTLTH